MQPTDLAFDDAAVRGFPGFSEDAPLDLDHLSAAAEQGFLRRITEGSFSAFADTAAAVGNCARPIRLVGHSDTIDSATGEVLSSYASDDAPLGVLYRPCGNRRADICPACSRVYARDTFEMIKAGVVGGKTVPDTVADNPLLFVTVTAPSFGPVHGARSRNGRRSGGRCRPRSRTVVCDHGRRLSCMAVHDQHDDLNGVPLCSDCYDWSSAVVWQWWAPELWRRTPNTLRRKLAQFLQTTESRLGELASVQFAKVAEYQDRGLVHFHALVRVDGSDGPGSPSPVDGPTLARLVEQTVRSMQLTAPAVDADDHDRIVAWGDQLDIRIVRAGARTDDPTGPLTEAQVAGYLAKYATKDVSSLRRPDHRLRPHLNRMAQICRQLADRADAFHGKGPQAPYGLLRKWVHMLGFRGHYSTKSRRFSITLGQLRRARHRFQKLAAAAARAGEPLDTRDLEARLLADEEETTLVVGSWAYQGTGWTNPGDEALAIAAAARAREYQQWRAEQRHSRRPQAA
jgi:hypothetical protein